MSDSSHFIVRPPTPADLNQMRRHVKEVTARELSRLEKVRADSTDEGQDEGEQTPSNDADGRGRERLTSYSSATRRSGWSAAPRTPYPREVTR